MEYIVNAAEAAKIDRISIHEIGIPRKAGERQGNGTPWSFHG